MGNEEEKESRQLKLVDEKKVKKTREKSGKKWVGVVLMVTILASLGFYFIAGQGAADLAAKLSARKATKVESAESEVIVPQKVEGKSWWNKVEEIWQPAVYEY